MFNKIYYRVSASLSHSTSDKKSTHKGATIKVCTTERNSTFNSYRVSASRAI